MSVNIIFSSADVIATWISGTEEQKLEHSAPFAGDRFGLDVTINYDGTFAAVGSLSSGNQEGRVHVFSRSGSTWTQDQVLSADVVDTNAFFGSTVSMNNDGNLLVVGSPNEDEGGFIQQGVVYVFSRSGFTWSQDQKIVCSIHAQSYGFGRSVVISPDGSTIAASSSHGVGNDYSVFIYRKPVSTWVQQVRKTGQASTASAKNLAISGDGSVIVVGNPSYDAPNTNQGVAYAWYNTNWASQQVFVNGGASAFDNYGDGVAINYDGTIIVIGASGKGTGGSAYIYKGAIGSWTSGGIHQTIIGGGVLANDNYGAGVSISDSGRTIAVSAYADDDQGSLSGSVIMWTSSDLDTWTEVEILNGSSAFSNRRYGRQLQMAGDGFRMMAAADCECGTIAGSAYIVVNG